MHNGHEWQKHDSMEDQSQARKWSPAVLLGLCVEIIDPILFPAILLLVALPVLTLVAVIGGAAILGRKIRRRYSHV